MSEVEIRLYPGETVTTWAVQIPGLDPTTGQCEPIDLGAWLDELIRRCHRSDMTPRVILACPPDVTAGDLRDGPGGSVMKLVQVQTILRVLGIYDYEPEWAGPDGVAA